MLNVERWMLKVHGSIADKFAGAFRRLETAAETRMIMKRAKRISAWTCNLDAALNSRPMSSNPLSFCATYGRVRRALVFSAWRVLPFIWLAFLLLTAIEPARAAAAVP